MTPDIRDANREFKEQVDRSLAFLRRALRFWAVVPITLLIGALACAAFFVLRKPAYRSETVVLYSQRAAPGEVIDASATRNVTVRLRELLMSRQRLEKVINEFGLFPERKKLGMAEAVEEIKKKIEYRAPGGDTFSVAFIGTSPSEAQRVTTRLVGNVIDEDAQLRKNQARATRDFLVIEKTKTEGALRSAERDLAAFMAEHPRFALDVTPLAGGAAIRATTAPSLAPAGDAAIAPGRAFIATADPGTSTSAPRPMAAAVNADSETARATAALAAARANLSEQLERFTPAHPDVRAAAAAVERAEARLGALGAAPAAAPTSAAATPESLAAPRPTTQRVQRAPVQRPPPVASGVAARELVALETEWLKLTRAVTAARLRADQVEAALFKADIQANSESGGRGFSMTVIDPAYLPVRPEPPGRTLIAAIFAGVSLLLGVFIALVRAITDDRIFEARDALGPAELLVEVPRAAVHRRAHVPG